MTSRKSNSRSSTVKKSGKKSGKKSKKSTKYVLGQEVWCEWNSIYYRAKINQIGIKFKEEQYYKVHYWKFSKKWDMAVAQSRLIELTKESRKRVLKLNRERSRSIKAQNKLKEKILKESRKPIPEQKPFLELYKVDDDCYFLNGHGGNYKYGFPQKKKVDELEKESSTSSTSVSIPSKRTELAGKLEAVSKKATKSTDDNQKQHKYNRKNSDELFLVEDIPVGGHLQKLQFSLNKIHSTSKNSVSNKRALDPECDIVKKIKTNAPRNDTMVSKNKEGKRANLSIPGKKRNALQNTDKEFDQIVEKLNAPKNTKHEDKFCTDSVNGSIEENSDEECTTSDTGESKLLESEDEDSNDQNCNSIVNQSRYEVNSELISNDSCHSESSDLSIQADSKPGSNLEDFNNCDKGSTFSEPEEQITIESDDSNTKCCPVIHRSCNEVNYESISNEENNLETAGLKPECINHLNEGNKISELDGQCLMEADYNDANCSSVNYLHNIINDDEENNISKPVEQSVLGPEDSHENIRLTIDQSRDKLFNNSSINDCNELKTIGVNAAISKPELNLNDKTHSFEAGINHFDEDISVLEADKRLLESQGVINEIGADVDNYEEPNSSKTTAIYSSESKHLNMNVTTAETNPESNIDSENCIFNVEIGHFEVEITTSESEEVLRMDEQYEIDSKDDSVSNESDINDFDEEITNTKSEEYIQFNNQQDFINSLGYTDNTDNKSIEMNYLDEEITISKPEEELQLVDDQNGIIPKESPKSFNSNCQHDSANILNLIHLSEIRNTMTSEVSFPINNFDHDGPTLNSNVHINEEILTSKLNELINLNEQQCVNSIDNIDHNKLCCETIQQNSPVEMENVITTLMSYNSDDEIVDSNKLQDFHHFVEIVTNSELEEKLRLEHSKYGSNGNNSRENEAGSKLNNSVEIKNYPQVCDKSDCEIIFMSIPQENDTSKNENSLRTTTSSSDSEINVDDSKKNTISGPVEKNKRRTKLNVSIKLENILGVKPYFISGDSLIKGQNLEKNHYLKLKSYMSTIESINAKKTNDNISAATTNGRPLNYNYTSSDSDHSELSYSSTSKCLTVIKKKVNNCENTAIKNFSSNASNINKRPRLSNTSVPKNVISKKKKMNTLDDEVIENLYLKEDSVNKSAVRKKSWVKESEEKNVYLNKDKTAIGDNGLYLSRNGSLSTNTSDHSDLVNSSESTELSMNSKQITEHVAEVPKLTNDQTSNTFHASTSHLPESPPESPQPEIVESENDRDAQTTDDDDDYVKTRRVTRKGAGKKVQGEQLDDVDRTIFAMYAYEKPLRAAKVKANEAISQMSKSERKMDPAAKRMKCIRKKDEEDSDIPKVLHLPECELSIPNYILRILIEDKHLLEEERFIGIVPAKPSTHDIFEDFSNKYSVCRDTLNTMVDLFDHTLNAFLLHPIERPKFKEMLQKYPGRHMTQIYGLPHLLRFLIKLPKILFVMKTQHNEFIPGAIHFIKGLFMYLDEEQIPISIFDYNCVMPDYYRMAYFT